jgi:hypothetical protein
VLHLPGGRKAKPLLRTFMCLLLGHESNRRGLSRFCGVFGAIWDCYPISATGQIEMAFYGNPSVYRFPRRRERVLPPICRADYFFTIPSLARSC